jgi:putative inorganic carbon (hco3(-)) transporter
MGDDRPAVQASRLRDAFERVQREWPWLTLFCPLHLQPAASASDPVWGLSLLSAEGQPQPLMEAVRGGLRTRDLYYPGYHHVSASLVPEGAVPTDERAVAITFYGTDLALVASVEAAGTLRVMPPFEDVVTLRPGTDAMQQHWLVRHLTPGVHTLHVVGSVAQIEMIQAMQVGNRPPVADIWMMTVPGSLLAVWLAAGIVEGLALVDWRWPYRRALVWAARVPQMWGLAALAALFAAAIAVPLPAGVAGTLLRLGMLALYGLAALLRPEAALIVAVATIPLAPLTVALGPGRFSITEIAILAAALARLGAALLRQERLLRIRSLNGVDLLLLVFLLWAAAGAVSAEYPREALREFRTVLAEPAILYLLLRLQGNDRRLWQRLVQVLFASASAVALYALARYPAAAGVIEAEGVRRARAYFGSPNNLALYLERLLPVGVSMGIAARGWWRRGFYAAGTLAIGLAIGLTYSRGAWLLGVPAGLLAVGLLWGGRLRRYALIALAGLAVILIPMSQTARFASLLDLQQGTSFLRVRLWQASWEMIKDYPWTGVGLDNFLYYYGDYILPGAEIERWLSHPHNLILNLWVRTGLGGLAVFAAMWGAALAPVVRRLRRGSVSPDPILIGLLAGGVAMLAHGMIDSAFFVSELAYWSMLFLAYLAQEQGLTKSPAGVTLALVCTNSTNDLSRSSEPKEEKSRDQCSDLPDLTPRGT